LENEPVPGVTDLEVIARGRTSIVYRATQSATKRAVAVKILDATVQDPGPLARFERECRIIASLGSHPNIVTVHDAGLTAEGHPYLVMELLPTSLADLVAERGALRWQEAVALGTEVASALAAAHAQGLLHRDVNPGTVRMAAGDLPKLADFGLIQYAAAAGIAHAAPELLQGKAIDERSDVYSLASTLHQTLTGVAPFTAADDNLGPLIDRIVAESPPSLTDHGVPAAVEAVILAGMAKDPTRRPLTATVFAQQLLAAAKSAGEATGAITRPVAVEAPTTTLASTPLAPLPRRQVGRAKRRWPALAGFAAVAALVIGGLAWAIGRSGGGDDPATVATIAGAPSTTDSTTNAANNTAVITSVALTTNPVSGYAFTVSFDGAAGTATLGGAASRSDEVALRGALGSVATLADDGFETRIGASPDNGTAAEGAVTLLLAMQEHLTVGTLTYDGASFQVTGQYRSENARLALQAVIDSTAIPVGRPDLSLAPVTTTGVTTSTVAGEFRITAFTSESGSSTFTIPADGVKHSFTYAVEVAGLTADQYCPVRSGLTEGRGPGLSDLDLGECFPLDTPPNQLTFRAFGAGTTTFTLWVCNGESRGGTCPGTKSTNGTTITVIAEPADA